MTSPTCSQLSAALAIAVGLALRSVALSGQDATDLEARVDRIFANWTASTPGCAVGTAINGKPTLTKAYGMADLEHDVRNTPETIFEAGSVSKQFTAAAVLLLARDGKLSLDDPARQYVPELPDYGEPLTIRHMLTHTSGLRDWGVVAAIAGWPRTTRVHTHSHVLDIVGRQRALNFTPGTRWSYTNTGYNLAAILVSRVSGMPFAEFTRRRIFEPLGMARTSWRDDHTRIVKGRAIAYSDERDGFHIDMPFENVHGNGGLLTTVGDLLKWKANFISPTVGNAAFVNEQQQPGRFTDGRAHDYAFGLTVGTYKGVREVSHRNKQTGVPLRIVGDKEGLRVDRGPALVAMSASRLVTANGRTWEIDGSGAPRSIDAFGTVDTYERVAPARPAIEQLKELVGTYVSDDAETTLRVAIDGESLVLKRRPDTTLELTPIYTDAFSGLDVGGPGTVIFRRDDSGRARAFSIVLDRVWDLRFTRQTEPRRTDTVGRKLRSRDSAARRPTQPRTTRSHRGAPALGPARRARLGSG